MTTAEDIQRIAGAEMEFLRDECRRVSTDFVAVVDALKIAKREYSTVVDAIAPWTLNAEHAAYMIHQLRRERDAMATELMLRGLRGDSPAAAERCSLCASRSHLGACNSLLGVAVLLSQAMGIIRARGEESGALGELVMNGSAMAVLGHQRASAQNESVEQ